MEGDGDLWVLKAEVMLLDVERPSVERTGPRPRAPSVLDRGEIMERDRDLVVVWPETLLEDRERFQE